MAARRADAAPAKDAAKMIRATATAPPLMGAIQSMTYDKWADEGFSAGTAASSNTYGVAAFLNK